MKKLSMFKEPKKHILLGVWLPFCVLFCWLLWKNLVLSGVMVVRYEASGNSRQMQLEDSQDLSVLRGTTGATENPVQVESIAKDEVTFSVGVPRPFSSAEVKLRYQNPDHRGHIRVGVRQANGAVVYQDLALENNALDTLPLWWQKVEENGITLWIKNEQLERQVKEAEAWFSDEKSALENRYKQEAAILQQQEAQGVTDSTKTQDEKRDLLRRRDTEIAVLIMERERRKAVSTAFSPPTITEFLDHLIDPSTTLLYNYTPPPVTISGYVPLTEEQTMKTNLLGSFSFLTYVGKDEDLSFRFSMQNRNLEIGKDGVVLTVTGSGETFLVKDFGAFGEDLATWVPSQESEISIEKSGLPEGVYTVSLKTTEDMLTSRIVTRQRYVSTQQPLPIVPEYHQFQENVDLDGYAYILARYPQAKQEGDWLVAETTFSQWLYRNEDRKMEFLLSQPGLAESGESLVLRDMKITFRRNPVTISVVWKKVQNMLAKIFFNDV